MRCSSTSSRRPTLLEPLLAAAALGHPASACTERTEESIHVAPMGFPVWSPFSTTAARPSATRPSTC